MDFRPQRSPVPPVHSRMHLTAVHTRLIFQLESSTPVIEFHQGLPSSYMLQAIQHLQSLVSLRDRSSCCTPKGPSLHRTPILLRDTSFPLHSRHTLSTCAPQCLVTHGHPVWIPKNPVLQRSRSESYMSWVRSLLRIWNCLLQLPEQLTSKEGCSVSF